MLDRDILRKGVRFCITGAFVTGVDLSMLWLWSRFTPPTVAVSAAYLIAVAVHFCLNKWWVFQNRRNAYAFQITGYAVCAGLCWLSTMAIFSIALQWFTTSIFIAKLVAIPPTTLLGFVLMKFVVFRDSSARDISKPQPTDNGQPFVKMEHGNQ